MDHVGRLRFVVLLRWATEFWPHDGGHLAIRSDAARTIRMGIECPNGRDRQELLVMVRRLSRSADLQSSRCAPSPSRALHGWNPLLHAARRRVTMGKCRRLPSKVISAVRRRPGLPLTSVTGLAQPDRRGQAARGSNRGWRFIGRRRW